MADLPKFELRAPGRTIFEKRFDKDPQGRTKLFVVYTDGTTLEATLEGSPQIEVKCSADFVFDRDAGQVRILPPREALD